LITSIIKGFTPNDAHLTGHSTVRHCLFSSGRDFRRPAKLHRKRKNCNMREIDDQQLKVEIDEISKKIESIIQQIEHMDPKPKDPAENQTQ
jgi:hypothetical protein